MIGPLNSSLFSGGALVSEGLSLPVSNESLYGFTGPFEANGAGGAPGDEDFEAKTIDRDELRELARQPAADRKEAEQREFARLRERWQAAGGRLVAPSPEAEVLDPAAMMVNGGTRLYSDLWGEIDLSRLNGGIAAYREQRGFAELARDLALASDRFELSAQILHLTLSAMHGNQKPTTLLKEMEWKTSAIDWRRAIYFMRLFDDSAFRTSYAGEAGYDRFAQKYFRGNPQKAYKVASALLSKDELAALQWGKAKRTNVREQAEVRTALLSGRYQDEEGYDRFALERYHGNCLKTYLIASSLLTDAQFAALQWGKQKQTNVSEQAKVRAALLSGKYNGEARYDRFAQEYFKDDSQKAYQVASALLTDAQFAALQWGKAKKTNVREQAELRATLLSGHYQGEAGYDRFALDRYQGDSQKAYQVASALLTDAQFASLQWGKQKQTNVREQAEVRTALLSGQYQSEAGYDRFALDRYQGDSQKAYQVASALLTDAQFAALQWGKA
ncbi:MAG: hypothetical protein WC956_01575, partial [bacterium]